MTVSEHTPGPWIASPPAVNEWPDRPCVADVDEGPSIYGPKGAKEGDRDADGRLIAAAPCMYAYIAVQADSGDQAAIELVERINGRS